MKKKEFGGSLLIFAFWLFVFFPMAIIYWAVKQVEVEVPEKR